jgi:hypothetical protein
MIRTLLIATIALGPAMAAEASDWRTNQDAYESGVFLDVSSYQALPDGHRRIWILQTYPKPVEASGGLVDFQIKLFEFNCSDRTLAVKFSVVSFMDGKSESNETAGAASPIAPGTNADRMAEVVCGDMTRLTAVPGDAPGIAHRYRAIAKMLLH